LLSFRRFWLRVKFSMWLNSNFLGIFKLLCLLMFRVIVSAHTTFRIFSCHLHVSAVFGCHQVDFTVLYLGILFHVLYCKIYLLARNVRNMQWDGSWMYNAPKVAFVLRVNTDKHSGNYSICTTCVIWIVVLMENFPLGGIVETEGVYIMRRTARPGTNGNE
jgi:hypothetical protein